MPRVSIVVPVYNGAKYIREAIGSVLRQTFTDFELIVIDDGSNDATPSILNEFHDRRLTVRAYPNAGLATSRNRGLNCATCELIAFLDADDLWLPDKLQLQVAALDENRQAALAYGWTDYIDGDGRPSHSGQHACDHGLVLERLLVSNFIENGSNPLIRRTALTECGEFDQSLDAAEDWDLWLRLAMRFPFAVVPQTLVLYRVHPESMSSSDVIRQERCALDVIDRAFRSSGAAPALRQQSIANLYKCLTYRALTMPVSRERGWIGLRFVRLAVQHDWSMLAQWRIGAIAMSKIGVALMLPPRVQRVWLNVIGCLRGSNVQQTEHIGL